MAALAFAWALSYSSRSTTPSPLVSISSNVGARTGTPREFCLQAAQGRMSRLTLAQRYWLQGEPAEMASPLGAAHRHGSRRQLGNTILCSQLSTHVPGFHSPVKAGSFSDRPSRSHHATQRLAHRSSMAASMPWRFRWIGEVSREPCGNTASHHLRQNRIWGRLWGRRVVAGLGLGLGSQWRVSRAAVSQTASCGDLCSTHSRHAHVGAFTGVSRRGRHRVGHRLWW